MCKILCMSMSMKVFYKYPCVPAAGADAGNAGSGDGWLAAPEAELIVPENAAAGLPSPPGWATR